MLWKERRASARSSATICRSMSSIPERSCHPTQQIVIESRRRARDHEGNDSNEGDRMSTQPVAAPKRAGTEDFMPLHGIDHIELYVGNALQSAFFYTRALGFKEVAYAGLETGVR